MLLREGAFGCWFSLVVFKAVCFLCSFLAEPWGDLHSVIVSFSGHIH